MNVMRFVGRTSREAMRKLRDALGPDALVLANRPCAEGVELLAAAPEALGPIGDAAGSPARRAEPDARRTGVAARAATPVAAQPDALPSGMSTVSFQDYVRQRLRDRHRSQAGDAAAPGAPSRDAAPGHTAGSGGAAGQAAGAARPAGRSGAPGASVASAGPTPAASAAVPVARAARAGAGPRSEAPVAREPGPTPVGAGARVPGVDHAGGRAAAIASPRTTFAGMHGPAAGLAAAGLHVPDPFGTAAGDPWPSSGRTERVAAAGGATASAPEHDALVAELQSLKGMISRQFATISWFEGVRRSPVQGRLLRSMVAAGFSLKLARSVVSRLPSDYGERDALVWLEEVLARNLRCAKPGEAFAAGGVYALVGPTGVGKTTTTAKIAARHVLKHGAQSVALITVDTYRLGAHDQLRAFGRILGVPVHVAHDASALHDLLRLRGSRQLVLIDTVGMGHRDERIGSLLMSLPRTDIRHVVVASCAAQAETIDASLRAYEARRADGVVLTKVDEAARLGGALDCLLRQRLRLLGVCDGQRVPEDWHAAEPARLLRRAMLAPPTGAFALDDEELPLVFGVAATLQGDVAHA